MLTIRMTRTSPTHHRLAYTREDGSGESAEVETKTFLQHDLLHYALESETGLMSGFFGLIAQGYSYEDLSGKVPPAYDTNEAMQIERTVGLLTGMTKGATSEQAMDVLANMYAADGQPMPSWLTKEALDRAYAHYMSVMGHWKSLRFGETLEVRFASVEQQ